METYGIIYRATNIVNGKVYIGQTVRSLKKRMSDHRLNSKHKKNYFSLSIEKYGFDSFLFIEIDSADDQNQLNEKERYWINFYNSTNHKYGYNTNQGGLNYGHVPESVKIKMSISKMGSAPTMKGKKHTPEAIEKISASKRGKKRIMSEEWKINIKNRILPPATEEQKKKISAALSGKPKFYNRRKIINIDTGIIYDSIKDAEKMLNVFGTSISACCRGKVKSAGGYHWEYYNPILSPASALPSASSLSEKSFEIGST